MFTHIWFFHILLRVTWDWSYVQWFFLYVVMHLFKRKLRVIIKKSDGMKIFEYNEC